MPMARRGTGGARCRRRGPGQEGAGRCCRLPIHRSSFSTRAPCGARSPRWTARADLARYIPRSPFLDWMVLPWSSSYRRRANAFQGVPVLSAVLSALRTSASAALAFLSPPVLLACGGTQCVQGMPAMSPASMDQQYDGAGRGRPSSQSSLDFGPPQMGPPGGQQPPSNLGPPPPLHMQQGQGPYGMPGGGMPAPGPPRVPPQQLAGSPSRNAGGSFPGDAERPARAPAPPQVSRSGRQVVQVSSTSHAMQLSTAQYSRTSSTISSSVYNVRR